MVGAGKCLRLPHLVPDPIQLGHGAFRPNQPKTGSGHATKTAISMTTLMQAIDMSPLEFFGSLAMFSNQVVLDAPMLGIADGDALNTSTVSARILLATATSERADAVKNGGGGGTCLG